MTLQQLIGELNTLALAYPEEAAHVQIVIKSGSTGIDYACDINTVTAESGESIVVSLKSTD